jgi:hypothetical protein
MSCNLVSHRPIPGFFYTNRAGQLLRVRLLLYVDGALSTIVLEHLDNRMLFISWDKWEAMDLSVYTEWHGTQSQCAELEYEV